MGKGYPVPCSGGCGTEVEQYTIGQGVWCAECGKRGFTWDPVSGRTTLGPVVTEVIRTGTPVVPNTPGHPGHNRIGVVAGARRTETDNELLYLVDFEGGHDIPADGEHEAVKNAVEDCGEYRAAEIKPWGQHR